MPFLSMHLSSGVEVKALCPAWADTEIVSGVDGEERKVFRFFVTLADTIMCQ